MLVVESDLLLGGQNAALGLTISSSPRVGNLPREDRRRRAATIACYCTAIKRRCGLD